MSHSLFYPHSLSALLRGKARAVLDATKNRLSSAPIIYVGEDADWIIRNVGSALSTHCLETTCGRVQCRLTARGTRHKVLHFGTLNVFLGKGGVFREPHRSNRVMLSWYHLFPGDSCSWVSRALNIVDLWHTSSQLQALRMRSFGIPADKILLAPLGVDLQIFHPWPQGERDRVRTSLGIPLDAFVVGSFQKDGDGWGAGDSPKLIKGPDILVETLAAFSTHHPVHVLLTGPSRGYVRHRLRDAGIPFRHDYLPTHDSVARYYQALDCYLVSSREEGLPMAVLEALACGIPLVTSPVGIVPDIIQHSVNGFIYPIGDSMKAAQHLLDLAHDPMSARRVIDAGLATAGQYGWKDVVERYFAPAYRRLREISN